MAKRVAIIDIGSNSVRMVIYEKVSRFAFHLLHEAKSKVRISEDAYKHNGSLQEVPMQRTFDALSDFIQISNSFKVNKLLCVATSALRDAPNKKDFLQKVKQKLKLNIKIISGEKEAYFGAIACANLLPQQHNALSIDIGGGSTELAYIDKNNVSHPLSLKLGTVRLKELYFDSNDIKGAVKYIDKQLEMLPIEKINTLIGIGGTFRAISNSIMKRTTYPLNKLHAYEYDATTLKQFIEELLHTKNNKELKNLFIDNNRFDVIKPGTLILQRVLKKINISKIITSGVGVREGVYLADLLRNSKHKFPHNYNTSVRYLIDTHVQDKQFSNNLNLLSKKIFDLTYEYFGIDYKYRYNLAIAAKLYPAGSSVHFYSQNKHTYYLIQSALEYGFTHHDIMLIATLTKYAKNKLPSSTHLQLYKQLLPKEQVTKTLSFLLSLSIALLSHRPRNLDFELNFKGNALHVSSTKKLYLSKEAVAKLECGHQDFKVLF
ncbi:Ppx/GppA phosphatase family protein [Sulfurimonas autotrophica]|uniref:Ppx/GppA phosphatase n=1 Tax=Sulfurimonas autotrophica (strain ATCC BAA-671 / DSM 16294 / JCM 11897 / OK10) TaxID=563040 RepID=E0UQD4_SULAO|nr:Ppx/GppA phosphatase family protein [Sulfurimonas autotrophica]ADN08736.1 Ppx/GppA phosphatase [Sulfurimonas autotrophica DSM 16294]